MTNINQINDPAQPFAVSNTTDTKSNGTESFENALNKAFDQPRTAKNGSTSASGLNEIFSPAPAAKIIKSSDAASGDTVSGKTDNLLKMLDSYSLILEDPTISLKSIAPVLEEIKKNAGTLLEATQQLADEDDELKQIATQTAAMAQTEYARFQRGDYLS